MVMDWMSSFFVGWVWFDVYEEVDWMLVWVDFDFVKFVLLNVLVIMVILLVVRVLVLLE